MEVEKESKKLAAKKQKAEFVLLPHFIIEIALSSKLLPICFSKLADEELKLNISNNHQAQFKLPGVEDVKEQLKGVRDLDLVKDRIQEVVQVLGDYKNRSEPGKKRTEYLDVTIHHFSLKYHKFRILSCCSTTCAPTTATTTF